MSNEQNLSFAEATKEISVARDMYRWLYPDEATSVFTEYEAKYNKAEDGSRKDLLEKDVFAVVTYPPRKKDVVENYYSYVCSQMIAHYAEQYTRENMVTMLNLLMRGMKNNYRYFSISIVEGISVSFADLLEAWNRTHPNEKTICLPDPDIG